MDHRHTQLMEELQAKIHGFTKTLESNKTAWKARCNALEQLSKILVQGLSIEDFSKRQQFAAVFIPMTEQFSSIFETQITDLRSEVVKTCAQTISTFAQELQLNFLKCLRRLLGPLTDSLRFPNKVIQGHIDDAICSIIRFCPSSAVLRAILTRFEAAKAKTQLKGYCAEYLRLCLASWTFEKFQTDRFACAIEGAILAGFRASVGATRSTAASSFWLYLGHYSHREASFRKKLNERDKALVKRGRVESSLARTHDARRRQPAVSHSGTTTSVSHTHSHQTSRPSARSQISPTSTADERACSSKSIRSSNSRSNLRNSDASKVVDSFTASTASFRNGNNTVARSPRNRTMSASSLVDSRSNKYSVSSARARSQSDSMYSLSHSPAAQHNTRRRASKENVACRPVAAAAVMETSPGILSDGDVYAHSCSDECVKNNVKAFASTGRLWQSATLPSSSSYAPVSARSHSDVFAHTSDAFNVKHSAASSSNRGHSAHRKRSQTVLDDVSHSGNSRKATAHSSSTTLKITKVSKDYPPTVRNVSSRNDLNTHPSSQSFEQRSFRGSQTIDHSRGIHDGFQHGKANDQQLNSYSEMQQQTAYKSNEISTRVEVSSRKSAQSQRSERSSTPVPSKEEQSLEDHVEIENARAENFLRKTEAESIERAKRMLRSRTAQRSPVDPERGANTSVVQCVLGGRTGSASAVMDYSLSRAKDALRTYSRVPTSRARTSCDPCGDDSRSHDKANELSLPLHAKRPGYPQSSPHGNPSSTSMSVNSYRTSTPSSSSSSTDVMHARASVDTTRSTHSSDTSTYPLCPTYTSTTSSRQYRERLATITDVESLVENHKSHISELTAVLDEEKLLLRNQSRNLMSVPDPSQYARDMVSLLKRLRLRTDVVLSKFEPFDHAKTKPSY